MKYVLVLIAALLAALAWLRPDTTPGWLIPSAIVLLVAAAGVQILVEHNERAAVAAGRFTGVLRRKRTLLLSRDKGVLPQLELGDSGAILRYEGAEGKPLFQIFDDSHVTVEMVGGRVKVSTIIRDQQGNVVAELVRNEWRVNANTAFDRNYSTDALEVRDATGDVVLQIRVMQDRVQFAGKFYDKSGNGVALGKGKDAAGNEGGCIEFTGPKRPRLMLSIPPIFRYPSDKHLGEFL